VRAAARRENGDIVWALVDVTAGPTLQAERLRLAAVNASATVTLSFDQHAVPAARVISIQPFDEWREQDRASLRLNGSLALGVARRCALLLESEALTAELDECRRSLDRASSEAMPEQRARASELALRAATELVVLGGGRAIALDHQAQRLAREALFLIALTCPIRPLPAQEVYKSVDAEGHVIYSDRGSTKTAPKSAVRVDQPDPAEVARLAKEQQMLKAEDLQRSKQEAIDAKKKATEDHAKQVACQNARNNYYRLKETPRIYQRDSDGNRVYYSDSDADAVREQARRAMTAACGS
jgi:hypothetical protein